MKNIFQAIHPDCKTRWSSLVEFIDSILKMEEPFRKMSQTLTRQKFSDEDFTRLRDLRDSLAPVKFLTTQLCSNSANIMMADAAFEATLQILKNQTGEFSTKLYERLRER